MAKFKGGTTVTESLEVSGNIVDLSGDVGTSGQILTAVESGDNEVKINASDGTTESAFGTAVAIGNNKIVVGAYQHDSVFGAAYVYDLDGTGQTKITASDGAQNDQFGFDVAVGNNKIVVGADGRTSDTGAVYVYDLNGFNEVKITASDGATGDAFGTAVAIGNNKIVVGAIGDTSDTGAVYVYDLDGSNELKITASDGATGDEFGRAVAIGNNKIVVGAHQDDDNGSNSGSVYVYDLDGSNELKITASDGATDDEFGSAVAIGNNKIVVGAYGDTSDTGAVYVYNLDGTGEVKITASDGATNDAFGNAVSVGNSKIIVGAVIESSFIGAAYVYDLDGSNEVKITASDGSGSGVEGSVTGDWFGYDVAVGNGKIVVGAGFDDVGANIDEGSVYVYDLAGTNWVTAGGGGGGTGISNYIKCAGTGTVSILSTDATNTWINPSWINTTPVFSNGTWTVSATSITVPSTGVYLVNVNIELSTPDTNGRYGPEVEITVNGTRVGYRASHSYLRGSGGHQESSSNQSTILNLSASNTVGINWRPTCTGRGNIINMNETSSFIEIVQII